MIHIFLLADPGMTFQTVEINPRGITFFIAKQKEI